MENNKIEELAKEMRRQYQREWRAKNKDKVAIIAKRYWEKKAEQILAQAAKEENDGNN